MIARKAAFNAINGFDPEVYSGGDSDFAVRMSRSGLRFGILPSEVSVHGDTRNQTEDGMRSLIKHYHHQRLLDNARKTGEKITLQRYRVITGNNCYFTSKR